MSDSKTHSVLFVADYLFQPAVAGNRKRVASLVESIQSWGYDVYFVILNRGFAAADLEATRRAVDGLWQYTFQPDLDPYGEPSSRTFLGRVRKRIARHTRQLFRAWPPPLDPDLEERCPGAFCRLVEEKVAQLEPTAVIAVYLWLSKCLRGLPQNVLKIIDSQDLMHVRLQQYQASGLYSFFQCTLADELRCLERADKVLVIQDHDRRLLNKYFPASKLVLTPHAHSICPPPANKKRGLRALFLGASHSANVEGVDWFLRKVWPIVLAQNCNVRLTIAGSVGHVVRRNVEAAHLLKQVEIAGTVDNVVDIMHSSDVLINPIIRGSGLKVKVVEALCCGLPVATTSKGAEGIPGIQQCPAVRMADTPTDFASAVVDLLTVQQNNYGAATSFANDHFSQHAAYQRFRQLLQEAACRAPSSPVRIPPVA